MDGGAWWAAVHGVAKSQELSDFTFTFHFHALEKELTTHSSVLAWRIPGMGSLVGCRLWGGTESDTIEATQQQQQTHWSVKIDNVNLWDTTFLPHHQSVRIVHDLITHPETPLPHLVFNNALLQGPPWWPSGSDFALPM